MPRKVFFSVEAWKELCEKGAKATVKTELSGASMWPLIRKNLDIVTIAPIQRELKVGDIVLFYRSDGKYVVHRVKKLWKDQVLTLGDGCLCDDGAIRRSDVYGLVTHMKRDGREVLLDTSFWRCYGRIWMNTLSIRRCLILILRGLRKKVRCGKS